MSARGDRPLEERAVARRRLFHIIEELQSGDEAVVAELADLHATAEERAWPEVVRVALLGEAIGAWYARDPGFGEAVEALIAKSVSDRDEVLYALGLAMRAIQPDPDTMVATDGDLARASVLLDGAKGEVLELVTAHTACGIAFAARSLWEIADEHYAAALRVAAEAVDDIEVVTQPVVFNLAEEQVSWASALRQLGDASGVLQRVRAWDEARCAVDQFSVPQPWTEELDSLGLLLHAISGEDVAGEARGLIEHLDTTRDFGRSRSLLTLAVALSEADTGRGGAKQAAEDAIAQLDPELYPQLFDLALYLAATLEGRDGADPAIRYANRLLSEHWADRMGRLAAMRALVEAERVARDNEMLRRHAQLDDLTGIANRRALVGHFDYLRGRSVERIAVIMIDVDRFKQVNDEHGHVAGDDALIALARLLERCVRPGDLAVRLGGDEFAVVLSDVDVDVAKMRAEAIMDAIEETSWELVTPGVSVSVSMGIACGTLPLAEQVRAAADSAMYRAKASGGSRVVIDGD